MQKLMNSLFVMAPESYLSLDGETVVAKIGEKVAGRFPLHSFASILYFGQRGVSPSLMGACADRGIGLSFWRESRENPTETYCSKRNNMRFLPMKRQVFALRRTLSPVKYIIPAGL